MMSNFVNGTWLDGGGGRFVSIDPARGETIWEGTAATAGDCADAVAAARSALPAWRDTPVEERRAVARRFAAILGERREELATLLSRETGKLLWETRAEIGTMIGKVALSEEAQTERAGVRETASDFGHAALRHRGHGVMAVLGPYNFPGHLPNGHIVPALLAGNAIVFKPSELTPAFGEITVRMWEAAGAPPGVVNLVQGARETGAALVDSDIDGVLFTGSPQAGRALRQATMDRPGVMLALELGGNNPLVVWDSPGAAASIIVHSAFVTSGQRCTCARRLIIPAGHRGDAIIDALEPVMRALRVAAWDDAGEAFMGPVVSDGAARLARDAVAGLKARGGRGIVDMADAGNRREAFVSPALIDMTGVDAPDAEIFAPVLQVMRVPDFAAAIAEANRTAFGLSAGLVSADPALWDRFLRNSRAGIVNRNRPTTGAAGNAPFGGIGASGNHRPSAYYAADYCAYPIASFEASLPTEMAIPGLN